MLVALRDSNLMEPSEFYALTAIILRVVDGWHSWLGPDPDDDSFCHYMVANPWAREILEKSYVDANAYSNDPHAYLTPEMATRDEAARSQHREFTIQEGRHWLTEPLEIWVENGRNDARFLNSIARELDPEFETLLQSNLTPVKFAHGGGKGELFKIVDALVQDEVRRSGRPLIRRVAFVDSDAKFPGQAQDLNPTRDALLDNGGLIFVHTLRRRALENYVGVSGINYWADFQGGKENRKAADLVIGLSPEQRYYYPIKSGIDPADLGNDIAGNPQAALYHDVALPPGRVRLKDLFWVVCHEEDIRPLLDLQDPQMVSEFSTLFSDLRDWL